MNATLIQAIRSALSALLESGAHSSHIMIHENYRGELGDLISLDGLPVKWLSRYRWRLAKEGICPTCLTQIDDLHSRSDARLFAFRCAECMALNVLHLP